MAQRTFTTVYIVIFLKKIVDQIIDMNIIGVVHRSS